jgi:FMN phosphatase YigB (HAD superfamily)
MEGTLIDHTYSKTIWEEDIPRLYSEKNNIGLGEARRKVIAEYELIGDARPEWYDVGYWFKRFNLDEDWRLLAERRKNKVRVYPEVEEVIMRLLKDFTLIVCSNTIRVFLDIQVSVVGDFFAHTFSAPSDFFTVKKDTVFYSKVISYLNLLPQEIVHIGDNYKYDYIAAKESGIRSYFIDRLGNEEGENIVHDLNQFISVLKDT